MGSMNATQNCGRKVLMTWKMTSFIVRWCAYSSSVFQFSYFVSMRARIEPRALTPWTWHSAIIVDNRIESGRPLICSPSGASARCTVQTTPCPPIIKRR